jgi:acyl-CoA synthetase (AMP-forming)/AMP-acid ligase II
MAKLDLEVTRASIALETSWLPACENIGEGIFLEIKPKDVIIIRGQNHYPQDIEHTVYKAHPCLAVGRGAAFSVPVGNEERLVVVQEVRRTDRNKIDGAQVVQTIFSCDLTATNRKDRWLEIQPQT